MFGYYGSHSQFHRLKALVRWLLCFCALYFALFLLLICWGTLAEPGHPHALPHFVFADGTDDSAVEPAHESNSAIEKRQETVKAEISFGASPKELPLRAKWGTPGSYTTDVIPAQPGDYTWRIFDEIEGESIDASMTRSPDIFSPVRAMSDAMFPAPEVEAQGVGSPLPLLLGALVWVYAADAKRYR